MTFLVREVDGYVAADGIQLLAGRHVLLEDEPVPAEAIDSLRTGVPCLLDGSRYDFREELFRVILVADYRSCCLDGDTRGIMGMSVAAAGHDESLACVVYYLGLAFLNEGLGASLVAYIDVLAVFHGKGFYYLVAFSGENLAIDHEVGTIIALATGKHTHASDNTHHCDAR